MKDMQDASQYQGESSVDSYRLIRLLGAGPLSRTYLAERKDAAGPQYALKIMDAVLVASEQEQEQVLLAVHRLQRLQHPHVLAIQENWIHGQVLCLATPYAEGGSLKQRLAVASGPAFPLKKTLALLKQIGEALHLAHQQQIVHANLKPENILFQANGNALLTDFRLGVLMQSEQAARISLVLGARYMAPEQFLQDQATPLSDQYALACLACELLTGSPPFDADDFEGIAREHLTELPVFPASINREQVQHLESVILKALAKKPEERYADIEAFIQALSAPPSLAPYIETAIIPTPGNQSSSQGLILPVPPEQRAPADAPTVAVGLEHQPQVPAGGQNQSYPFVTSHPTPSTRQKPTAARLSPKKFWLVTGLVGLAMGLTLSGLLAFFLSSSSGHYAAGISQSQTTPATAPSSTPNTAVGSTPTIQSGSTPTAQPTPKVATPAPSPSPVATATPTGGIVSTGNCAVSYKVTSQWSGGFVVSITITNSGTSPISGWTLAFTFPGDQRVTNGWNGNFTQSGMQVSISNAPYNAQLEAGFSVVPGFQGDWKESNAAPNLFTLNGQRCSVLAE